MAEIELNNITKRFGDLVAVDDVNLTVKDGEFLCLLGPSGCGKTTTLRIVAGLEKQSEGDVRIDDTVVNDLRPQDRNLAMVFQSNTVYPHLTVFENLAFPLRARKVDSETIDEQVHDVAEILDISDKLDSDPTDLSGGQQQRVALGRAMIRSPDAFLMDEPLSDLDAKLRRHMRVEISKLHEDLETTTIYVTHDQIEAMTMADRIAVMRDGAIEQLGTPTEVYEQPVNTWVASFMGEPGMSTIAGRFENGRVILGDDTLELELPENTDLPEYDGPMTLGVRPENIVLSDGGLEVNVEATEKIGDGVILHMTVNGVEMIGQVHPSTMVEMGDTVEIAFTEALHLFDESGEVLTRVTDDGPWVPRRQATAEANDD